RLADGANHRERRRRGPSRRALLRRELQGGLGGHRPASRCPSTRKHPIPIGSITVTPTITHHVRGPCRGYSQLTQVVDLRGQGGIRPRDTLLTYTRSPGVRLQPLGPLSRDAARAQPSGLPGARQRAPGGLPPPYSTIRGSIAVTPCSASVRADSTSLMNSPRYPCGSSPRAPRASDSTCSQLAAPLCSESRSSSANSATADAHRVSSDAFPVRSFTGCSSSLLVEPFGSL